MYPAIRKKLPNLGKAKIIHLSFELFYRQRGDRRIHRKGKQTSSCEARLDYFDFESTLYLDNEREFSLLNPLTILSLV